MTCKWINPDGNRCDFPVERNGKYCYRHLPMAYAGYPHTDAPDDKPIVITGRPQAGNSADIRLVPRLTNGERDRHWKDGMEKHLGKKNKKKQSKFRSILWAEADFPRHIDGIFFQSLKEYEDFVYGQYDASVTEETTYYDELDASPATKAWLGKGGVIATTDDDWEPDADDWSRMLADYNRSNESRYHSSSTSGYSYKAAPKKTLKPNTYVKLETILHMHYYIACDKDSKYYSVWISCSNPEILDSIMADVLAKMPCGVTQIQDARYHTSGAYKDYDDAYSRFSCGGESFWNIRTRIDRAKDPNWIPPNVRKFAFEGLWEMVPEEYQKAAREWFDKGCPGWWGTWHSKHNNGSTKKIQRKGKGLTVARHTPPLALGKAIVLRDPKKEMQDFLLKSSGARPLTREVAIKGQTGCRMREWDGGICGKPVVTPPYCDKHNIQIYGF